MIYVLFFISQIDIKPLYIMLLVAYVCAFQDFIFQTFVHLSGSLQFLKMTGGGNSNVVPVRLCITFLDRELVLSVSLLTVV